MNMLFQSQPPVLVVDNLSLEFTNGPSRIHALDGVSFGLARGETLCLVGESGCGKSVTAMALMRLLPKSSARITSGAIRLTGTDLIGLPERSMQTIRGNRIGMVFQDPMTSLNPVHTVGMQIAETVRRHKRVGRREAYARARQMLDLVRIPDAGNRLNAYPHELSGGQRQRVMIAMALACDPELLIADEPTTALDVTVQAQILELIADLKTELGMSVLLITHDLGVVAATADRMMVMYAGRIVEEGPVERIFARPSHGYTAGLLRSLPGHGAARRGTLTEIVGTVPRLDRPVEGCVYAPRCGFAEAGCTASLPPAREIEAGHRSSCIREAAVFAAMRDHDIVRSWA
ncbi:ABC transporter ATP-binding protein [Mesorhizobium sp. L-8-3]|uniref:ABC transporter ATP-binding protein n=1 Tax=Mesorhizobium sp. L-8-3 TaxID=2744522 RepID=UPI0019389FDC|nr:ABC transporter ATP-binding protein [Mesorhizobium sp. L-8-3]BCH20546.1 putative peptide ABC transporter ATP-binding protein y4tR [Mesorhizobium sp. L-8-3]